LGDDVLEKPLKLHRGDTIGIIAPASGIKDESRLVNGIEILKAMGYKVLIGKSCYERNGFLSGLDTLRAYDLNCFFLNKDINAIFCLRGGYGSIRILDKIDYNIIKSNPKIFTGYSDITFLNISIYKMSNLVTFHGPMVASDIADGDAFTIESLVNCLEGRIKTHSYNLDPLVSGNCSGKIFGGNLSVLCSFVNTKYDINWKDKILFIEDINEEPYSIDRKLYQLKLSSLFNKVNGVILGQFNSCYSNDSESQTVIEVFKEFFYNFNKPVYSGFMAGHGLHKITVPIGVKIEITNNILEFTEEGVR
jgi:muramoyltetrapeptide carboxypeptidase